MTKMCSSTMRKWCAVAGVGVVCVTGPAALYCATLDFQLVRQATQSVSQEWTQHGHDARRTGYTPQYVPTPWRWRWSWNGPNASGGIAAGHHTLPRNVQPITGGGYVFIADGANGVRVLSKTDGTVVRTISPGGNCNATPAYDPSSGMLYIPSSNGNLYKVNPANGTVVGSYNAGSAIVGAPCLITGRVFVSAGNHVRAVNTADMSPAWSYDAGSPLRTPPSYSPSRDCVVAGSYDLYVHAVNNGTASPGSRKWRVKPTVCDPSDDPNSSYDNNLATFMWNWPVVAEVHGLVLVKTQIDKYSMWRWSPWPSDNAQMRANLQNVPTDQVLFAIDLDDGSVPFICNVGHGGWGDGDIMPMGPAPVVKRLDDGGEVVYAVVRGIGPDGNWDSQFGEMVLDSTTVSGYLAGYVRFIQYGNLYGRGLGWPSPYNNCDFPPSDEQPFISVSSNIVFGGHWALGIGARITDRSASRGTPSNPIRSEPIPHFVTSTNQNGGVPSFSASHYSNTGFAHQPDWRAVPYGFYIYWDQGNVYDAYWSYYACWVVSEDVILYRSCDSAVICLENGNPMARTQDDAWWSYAAHGDGIADETHLVETLNPGAKERPATGPAVIPFEEAADHIGEEKTVVGEIRSICNNGKAVYLGFRNPHHGVLVVRIMKPHWDAFPQPPDRWYRVGDVIQVTGRIQWYQNDPVIYVTEPGQIRVIPQISLQPCGDLQGSCGVPRVFALK